MTPYEAYLRAVEHGPSDDTRAAVEGSEWQTEYEERFGLEPEPETPATPKEAYQHAVEHGPSDDTRAAACRDPAWAYRYAYYVDRAPHDDTRAGACQDPGRAYLYALDVDRAPRPDTRAAVEGTEYQSLYEERFGLEPESALSPYEAYETALRDRPSDETRNAACADPYYAYSYAIDLDRAPHPDTRAAVEGTRWQSLYEQRLESNMSLYQKFQEILGVIDPEESPVAFRAWSKAADLVSKEHWKNEEFRVKVSHTPVEYVWPSWSKDIEGDWVLPANSAWVEQRGAEFYVHNLDHNAPYPSLVEAQIAAQRVITGAGQ